MRRNSSGREAHVSDNAGTTSGAEGKDAGDEAAPAKKTKAWFEARADELTSDRPALIQLLKDHDALGTKVEKAEAKAKGKVLGDEALEAELHKKLNAAVRGIHATKFKQFKPFGGVDQTSRISSVVKGVTEQVFDAIFKDAPGKKGKKCDLLPGDFVSVLRLRDGRVVGWRDIIGLAAIEKARADPNFQRLPNWPDDLSWHNNCWCSLCHYKTNTPYAEQHHLAPIGPLKASLVGTEMKITGSLGYQIRGAYLKSVGLEELLE